MRKPCCDKRDTNKGAWSKQEDQKLIDYIQKHGEGSWRTLPQAAGLLRCGKSCRLRWINYLRPDLKRGNFAEDEEDLIIKLHALLGNRWSLIAGRLPGRTDNEVKNYWNSHLRRKLQKMGIDPNNHRLNQNLPRSQTPDASGSTSSSSLKTNVTPADKSSKSAGDHPEVFDAENVSGDIPDIPRGLPDLNLDLTISVPSSSLTKVEEEEQNPYASKVARDVRSAESPTLLLFA
ncbi:hypothetical protein BT93_G1650 [Corymbia citriodora subsp. variegata]|nr:hypothetical protein BT93_G1650 [Corymbia citriodora subsp. variegata]